MIPLETDASHLKSINTPTIAIMRLSALGDVTNALSSVSCIKKHYPKARIIWFVGKVEHQLLKDIPHLKFEVIDKKHSFKERSRIKKKYKDIKFDVLLHMQMSLRSSLMVKALKAKKVIGFDAQRTREFQWFFTTEKISNPKTPNAVDVFMEFAYSIGVPKDQKPFWDFGDFCSTDELRDLTQLKPKETYISIVVSGSQPDRAWSSKKNAKVIDWIIKNTHHKVCLIGGPSAFEKNRSQEILKQLQSPKESVINLTGKTNLKMLKTIIKNSQALISPDTGPIHISSALGVPTVGLYVHMPKEITGPYNHLESTVDKYKKALKLYYGKVAPNFQNGIIKRIKHRSEAIDLIETSEVIDKLHKILKIE